MHFKRSVFLLAFPILLFSCIPEANEKKIKTEIKTDTLGIQGRYINSTFIQKNITLLPEEIPVYCFEMNFYSCDSVEINGGFEAYKLAYKKEGNSYVLLNATWKGNMLFNINDNNNLILEDTAWTGIKTHSEFIKVSDNHDQQCAFDYYLNERLIAGDYQLYKNSKPTGHKIKLTPDGKISGLDMFTSYSLCYSGDCVAETSPSSRTIGLSGKNISETYAFTLDTNCIHFYEIGESPPDIKGQEPIKGLAFELKR